MNEFIEKLIARIMLESASCKVYKLINPNKEDIAEFNAYKKCIEIINELAEEHNGGWINVDERLPEEYAEVLGYGIDGHIYMVELYDTKIYGKVWKQWNGGDIRLKFILAWQPLPEPYKE